MCPQTTSASSTPASRSTSVSSDVIGVMLSQWLRGEPWTTRIGGPSGQRRQSWSGQVASRGRQSARSATSRWSEPYQVGSLQAGSARGVAQSVR